jgi:MFS family permease
MLLASQYVQMASAFGLATLVFSGIVRPEVASNPWQAIWPVLTLSFVTGCAQAFGGPAYQSLIPSLVTTAALPNAIALNSIQFNLARVIGPVLAGATLAGLQGVGVSEQRAMALCFAINGCSFLVVIGSLLSLRITHTARAVSRSLLEELRGGLSYVRHERRLLALTVLAAATTFFGAPLMTLLPLVAQNVFGEGVAEYSRLMASSGIGAVSGALVVAWLGRFRRMGLTALVVQVAFGILIAGFSLSRVLWVSYALVFLAGAAMIIVFSTVTSLVQLIAPNALRGRVMSIYMMAFRGGMPLGSLVSGYAATLVPAPTVLFATGTMLTLIAAWFLLRGGSVRDG